MIFRPIAAALLAALGAAAPLHALSVAERDFADLVARAEQIVAGTITAIDAGENERGGPMTFVAVDDLTVLKGEVEPPLVLQIHGGMTREGIFMHVPDMPRFEVGERVVLFVRGNGREFFPLVGVWQGRFDIRHDPERGVAVVERADGTVVTGMEHGRVQSAQRGAEAARRALTLEEFRDLIRDELRAPSR